MNKKRMIRDQSKKKKKNNEGSFVGLGKQKIVIFSLKSFLFVYYSRLTCNEKTMIKNPNPKGT